MSVLGALLLGWGGAFPLAFPDDGAFEFDVNPMTESMRSAMGSSPVKTRCSVANTARTFVDEALH